MYFFQTIDAVMRVIRAFIWKCFHYPREKIIIEQIWKMVRESRKKAVGFTKAELPKIFECGPTY